MRASPWREVFFHHINTKIFLARAPPCCRCLGRPRIQRTLVGRGLLHSCDASEMLAQQHSGFSVGLCVCIGGHERVALERLLRHCARPVTGRRL
jgi:hypothetical protein